ncbi:Wzz/FepE/Etk N-terminal domain-containing protein [Marinifilum sp. D737]|uniref:Wzz/FepE/Etk N-terminal domain-containing protein n=1 Tax=Marinifilum sp. D737 TaxID=2969628 RepID=UPI0022747574|nr:Wzz/FepE/Etk N-terminal domain-containing protein [Marinifilum sp. D737]MCY1634893.1 Wzz/FepE/Etk N-terminal domain-containing protein [Marinifilum sp. D737]
MTNIKDTNQTDAIRSQHEDEIDLIALAKTLWEGRKTVIKTTVIFMFMGLFVAIFSEKEYTASCTMVPQSAEGGSKLGGSLGGLAAMAGINLGSMGGGSDIPPTLYPKLMESVPFLKEMMKTPLTIKGQEGKVTFATYYNEIYKPGLFGYIKNYTVGLPGLIIGAIKGNTSANVNVELNSEEGLQSISFVEKKLIKILLSQLSLEVNDKDGYIYLSAQMPEAKAAAQMVQKAQILLQDAITDFKIQKANDQLSFVEERYAEKKMESIKAQKNLASFLDRNKNVSKATAQTELERLTADYNLVYGVYSELAKQLEKQKIQVKEDTPVFTIIKPVVIPYDKSKPKRSMILVIWTFFGGVIGVSLVYGKQLIAKAKIVWLEEKVE